jgi:hypothetical protein
MAFWLTVQAGSRRIRIPLLFLLPLALAADLAALAVLSAWGVWKRSGLLLRLGRGFFLSRLTLALLLHGGRFCVGVRDQGQLVRVHGGWRYPRARAA